MKSFKINNNLEIICEWKKTRNGFKHESTLLKNGIKIDSTKICYLNRTWESFEFESVIIRILDKTKILSDKQKTKFLQEASGKVKEEINKEFGNISTIAKLGELFGQNQKEKNDWKARMLKAGLENKGFIMPDNWDKLSENDKTKRLDGVIEMLSKPLF